jgi:glycosyltransferase involved in cell wall biosynthesis
MPGGVGDYTREVARGLGSQSIQVGVLTSQAARGKPPLEDSTFSLFPRIHKWDWSSLGVVRETLREFPADIVHIEYQTGAYGMHPAVNFLPHWLRLTKREGLGRDQGARRSVRCVTTFHDLRVPYLFPKAGPVRAWVTRELARSSAAVIATNEQDGLQLERWGVQAHLIPIGSNVAVSPPSGYVRAEWRARLGVAENEMLLCHFGFVNPSKGLESLLHALQRLTTEGCPNSPRLLMIGGPTGANDRVGAAYLDRLQEQIKGLGLENRILWTGYTPSEQVTANFLASDLCVLPYREGAAFHHGTLMAALAHGMPIVTTRTLGDAHQPDRLVNALPVLRDGENCLLVPPDDPDALAGAIRRALASPALCTRLRQGAGDLALAFRWDRIVWQHLELYRELIGD